MSRIARHTFASSGLDSDTFRVLRFEGTEAISEPFRFVVHLVSKDAEVDFAKVIDKPATLTMLRGDDPSEIDGVISDFQQSHAAGGQSDFRYVYRAVLVPRIWRLALSEQSRIFQNLTVQEIVSTILKAAGVDCKWMLKASYKPREYTTQYQESDLAFVQRLLEFEGIRYYIEHAKGKDTVIFSDDASDAVTIADDDTLAYSHGDGLVAQDDVETVKNFRVRQRMVTAETKLKDYNYRTPEDDIFATSPVSGKPSLGVRSEAMTHTMTPTRNERLVKVRAEEVTSTREVMTGRSDCLRFRTGYRFTLDRHFRTSLNQAYLLTHITHEGSQPDSGEAQGASETTESSYANRFRCVAAAIPFRPPRKTPVPTLPGILTAKVESTNGSNVATGQYAPIDDQGRYRVRFPFDIGDASNAQATKPVRLAQPYSGPGYGQHFPVHKGAEMVIACVDGNIDRLVGLGTVPNPTQKSPVTSANPAENTVKTAADNRIVLKDTMNAVGIDLSSPTSESRIHIGAADGSVEGIQLETKGSTLVHGGGSVWVKAGESSPEALMGADLNTVGIAMTAVDSAIGLILSAMGARLHNASFRTGLLGANLLGTAFGAANTAAGTGLGIGMSGIFMTSPGGIIMATSAGISAYAGLGGIGLTSATGIDLTAATLGMNLLVGAGGINIGAGQGGIATTAALNDIDTLAKSGKVTVTALQNVETKSETESITSEAMLKIEQKAGTSVKIESGTDTAIAAGTAVKVESGTDTLIKGTTKLTLECGATKLEMSPEGTVRLTSGTHSITLDAAGVKINSLGTLTAKSISAMSLESSLTAELKAGVMASVKGAIVQIN
ncbi:type VI secretion system Vgr family protein [Rubrivirga sp. IMCC43871]|uniref:type VI secretion system Vgr family protein n=1 Tax=Rubrivirga sp. IMCC43871 TaxID=3391575 RepID=UPI00398FAAE4